MSSTRHRPAWTLIEVLVTVGLLALLGALLVPAVQKARESGHQTVCKNNLRQLVVATHNHHQVIGTLPPYATGMPGTLYANWFHYLGPYLETDPGAAPPLPPDQAAIVSSTPLPSNVQFPVLQCPSDPSAYLETYLGKTNYLANYYAFGDGRGGWFPPPQRFAAFRNGLSNAVLFAECYRYCAGLPRVALETPFYHTFGVTQDAKASDDPSYLPNDYTMFQVQPDLGDGPGSCDKWRTQTPHIVMHIAVADGSVRAVAADIAPETWRHVIQPASGLAPGGDW